MDRYEDILRLVMMTAAAILVVLMMFVFIGLLWSGKAFAHSWYEPECCDLRDCEPIPPDQVKVTPDGYVTPDGQLIPFASARTSADRDYHWCKYQRNSTAVIWPLEKRACFYAPAMGG